MRDQQGTITLSRARGGYRDVFRRYQVLIDGTQVGAIGRGQSLRLDVPAGHHGVQLMIDWCTSPLVGVEVEPGQTVALSCAPGTADPSRALDAVTLGASDYIVLRPMPDEAEVLAVRVPLGTRLRLANAFLGALAMLTFLLGLLVRVTGAAPHTAGVMTGCGALGFAATALVMRLTRPR